MKIIFVDAENIGLKELEKVKATVVDKVFVFSKSEAVKLACEKSLFLYLSDYPTGSNQADFYIVAYLSRILSSLENKQFGAVNFELYTNDESLIAAFEFQCDQRGASCRIVRTKDDTVVNLPKPAAPSAKTPQDRVYSALKSPRSLDPSLQKHLGLSKSDFTKAINELSKANKIQRFEGSKRKWVQC